MGCSFFIGNFGSWFTISNTLLYRQTVEISDDIVKGHSITPVRNDAGTMPTTESTQSPIGIFLTRRHRVLNILTSKLDSPLAAQWVEKGHYPCMLTSSLKVTRICTGLRYWKSENIWLSTITIWLLFFLLRMRVVSVVFVMTRMHRRLAGCLRCNWALCKSNIMLLLLDTFGND